MSPGLKLEGPALDYAKKRISSNDPNNRLIVFEGLDGVGKTTTVKTVAEKLGAVHFGSPINPLVRQLRKEVDATALQDPIARFRFYTLSNVLDTVTLQEHLGNGSLVLLDRFHLSTIVGNTSLGANICEESFVVNGDYDDTDLIPRVTFLLTASSEAIASRMAARPGNNSLDFDVDHQRKMRSLFEQLTEHGLIPVDTTNLGIDQVVELIIEKIIGLGVYPPADLR